jgi:hypothetical protein
MKQIAIKPKDKGAGLRELQRRGWLLIDATYAPIDKKFGSGDPQRDAVLLRDYPHLKSDILALSAGRQLPIISIKENVCRVQDTRQLRWLKLHRLDRMREPKSKSRLCCGHCKRVRENAGVTPGRSKERRSHDMSIDAGANRKNRAENAAQKAVAERQAKRSIRARKCATLLSFG